MYKLHELLKPCFVCNSKLHYNLLLNPMEDSKPIDRQQYKGFIKNDEIQFTLIQNDYIKPNEVIITIDLFSHKLQGDFVKNKFFDRSPNLILSCDNCGSSTFFNKPKNIDNQYLDFLSIKEETFIFKGKYSIFNNHVDKISKIFIFGQKGFQVPFFDLEKLKTLEKFQEKIETYLLFN